MNDNRTDTFALLASRGVCQCHRRTDPLVQIVSYHGSESGVWVRKSKVKR